MSELIQKNDNRVTIRWKLLTGASALALTAYVSSAALAKADDADRPQVWIELGGQLSRLQDAQEPFTPPLMAARPSIFSLSQKFEKPPLYSLDEFGAISFQPDNSNWVFSASVQYGRSKSYKHYLQQTNPEPATKYVGFNHEKHIHYPYAQRFAETSARTSEQHAIIDFEAGKDVGLGTFGSQDSSSVVSLGVRIAQFRSKSNIALKSDPDFHFHYKYFTYLPYFHHTKFVSQTFHSNLASMTAKRSFHGIGPSVSWKGSAALAGNRQDGEIAMDWGIDAAILLGRQRTQTHHQSTARYFHGTNFKATGVPYTTGHFPAHPDHTRSRNVTVPNVGGFASLSYQYANAKLSFGYKADFFFNAIDGGIDARKSENRGFFGPYASISIGLGD